MEIKNKKMKYNFALWFILLVCSSCFGKDAEKRSNPVPTSKSQVDSVKIVVNYFLLHDVFINSYVISDRDVDEVYQNKREWIQKYFPTILEKYDLTLYSQFSIACYLYLEGNKKYLQNLWKQHKGLAGSEEQNIFPSDEFKPILNLLNYFKITPSMAKNEGKQ